MAQQAIPGGVWLGPGMEFPGMPGVGFTSTIQDAAGESTAMIGYAHLSTGPGTSKVVSSAGGKIHVVFAATSTFTQALGTTKIQVGIQDVVLTTGIEDTTYDVYDILESGTDTITQDVIKTVTMSNGTKTIAHGDLIAVVIEMTEWVTGDTVRPKYVNGTSLFPYITIDTGSGPAKTSGAPFVTIESDDGTLITLGSGLGVFSELHTSFSSSSSPDEYALVFQVPFTCQIDQLGGMVSEIDTTEDGELILYSDPLGTPTVMTSGTAKATIDPDLQSGGAAAATLIQTHQIPVTTLTANTSYAVAYRPTSTAVRSLMMHTLPVATARAMQHFGTTASRYDRENNTGAFTNQSTTVFPALAIHVCAVDTGSAGGGTAMLINSGGLVS